jgi:hypothetical protein
VAGGAGRRSAAGHAANAGTKTSDAGGLYPIEAWGLTVVASPALDDDLGLAQSVEDFTVEQLITKAGIEALDVAVLPRAAALDVSGLGADRRDPVPHGLRDEFRSVVGPDVTGYATQDEEVGQYVDDIDRLELSGDTDRQAFMGNSSSTLSIRYLRPSWVRCSTKS